MLCKWNILICKLFEERKQKKNASTTLKSKLSQSCVSFQGGVHTSFIDIDNSVVQYRLNGIQIKAPVPNGLHNTMPNIKYKIHRILILGL